MFLMPYYNDKKMFLGTSSDIVVWGFRILVFRLEVWGSKLASLSESHSRPP